MDSNAAIAFFFFFGFIDSYRLFTITVSYCCFYVKFTFHCLQLPFIIILNISTDHLRLLLRFLFSTICIYY